MLPLGTCWFVYFIKMAFQSIGYYGPYAQKAGAYPGGCKPGGLSESLILAHRSKVKEFRPYPPHFCAPVSFPPWSPCLRLNGRGRSKDKPQWDKQKFGTCKITFQSQFAQFGAFLFAWGAHTESGTLSLQKVGGGVACNRPWKALLIYLSIFSLFVFSFRFPLFLSLFSLSFIASL